MNAIHASTEISLYIIVLQIITKFICYIYYPHYKIDKKTTMRYASIILTSLLLNVVTQFVRSLMSDDVDFVAVVVVVVEVVGVC